MNLAQQFQTSERPARMVGLFTMRALRPSELERLVGACLGAMKEEEPGASLTLTPLGDPPPALELQRTWRVTVKDGETAAPHDCLVQVFLMDDPGSPHKEMLEHLHGMDDELGRQGEEAAQNALTYLTVASGRLDDAARVHPYLNLVSLFSSALGAYIVDAAAAIVSKDPGEWADACEMSLQLEKEMGLLRR